MTTYAESIDQHYAKNWRKATKFVRHSAGPVEDLPKEFGILVTERAVDMIAFATRCMSQPSDPERLELHALCRPSDSNRNHLVEILTAVAHYHRTGSRLGLGHSVNFGKAWIPGSSCTHGVVSLPYLDGPKLEWLAGNDIRFLWLIPVTEEEVAFKKAHGLDALETRFETAQFDFLDPNRPSVV